MKVPDSGKIISVIYIGAALIGVYLIYKIFSGVGLIKTGAKKKEIAARSEAEIKLRGSEYFNPLFLKTKVDAYKSKLDSAEVKLMVQEIRQALRGLGTNEEKIFSVFGRLKSKWNISELSFYYRYVYNRDLLTDLLNDLTDKEQLILWDIISKLKEN